MALDQDKLDEFLGRFVGDLGATMAAGTIVVGDRLGLYRALATGPATPDELAERTGTVPRYVAEWLRGQAAGGYVGFDPVTGSYGLTEEQAFALADPDGAVYVPGAFVLASAALRAEPQITEAFRTGAGVGWHEHDDDVFTAASCSSARATWPTWCRAGSPHWTAWRPSSPRRAGGRHRLRAGRVHGAARGRLPRLDLRRLGLPRGLGRDRPQAGRRRRGRRPHRVRGRLRPDLQRHRIRPGRQLRLPARHGRPARCRPPRPAGDRPRRHLADRRAAAGDTVADNLNPVGRAYYGFSSFLCVPNALSQPGGYALGAQAGEAAVRDVVTAAGFTRFRRAAETPFNLVFEARP